MITCTCKKCGKKFDLPDWQVKRGRGKYCGQECFHSDQPGKIRPSMRKRIAKICVVCGTRFESGGRAGDKNKVFCSWECRYKGRYRSGEKSNELSDIDAAYLAGLVDGEGSIFLYMRRDVVSVRLTISNTNRPVLDWVENTTGVGGVASVERDSARHKTANFWHVNSDGAESVIKKIRPYLKIKMRQADLALSVQERLRNPALKSDHSWQKEVYEQMRLLNKRGKS